MKLFLRFIEQANFLALFKVKYEEKSLRMPDVRDETLQE